MLRTRLFVMFAMSFALASASLASDLGYVDCSKYPGTTQVLDKAGMTSGVVASVSCGERFTILARGEFFSQIRTKDGKVGYLYTYQVTLDTSAAPKPPTAPTPPPAPASNSSALAATSAKDKFKIISMTPSSPAVPAPASSATTPASASTQNSAPPTTPAMAPPPQTKPSEPVSAATPQSAVKPASPAQPVAAAQPSPVPPTQTEAPPSVAVDQPRQAPPVAKPEASASAPSEPAPSQPAVESPQIQVRRPDNPPVFQSASRVSTIELFAGYGFTRFGYSGNGTNLNGVLGSFGLNLMPRLQIIGDASYNHVTIRGGTNPIYGTPTTSGSSNVVYGNHFGPRFFLRSRGSRGPVPFVEALVGGTRIDTTASGATTSQNGLSYKVGGGVDIAISRHLAVRLIDADYYRVSFLKSAPNNYSASAGIIIRFGGRPRF